jgi:hypothetical protein
MIEGDTTINYTINYGDTTINYNSDLSGLVNIKNFSGEIEIEFTWAI